MVALQCFVLLPAVTEGVYASDTVTIDVEYQDENGTYASRMVDASWIEGSGANSKTFTVLDEEGNPQEVTGYLLKGILNETGINNKVDSCEINGNSYTWGSSNLYVAYDGDDLKLYKVNDHDGELELEGVDYIYIKRSSGLKPVSFATKPYATKTSPTVGDTLKIKYKLDIDDFYKNSDGYDEGSATTLTWKGNNKVTLLKTTTSGKSGFIKAKVKKPGSIVIKPHSDMFEELTDGVTVSFTGQQTTTKYTTRSYTTSGYRPYTTRSTYTPGIGTTRSTLATAPTTALRPTETASTMAPSFQTITVKEVWMSPVIEQPQEILYYDEEGNPVYDESTDEVWEDEEDAAEEDTIKDWDEDGVSVPAAAGSAAVAAAACGVGALGRVRRFRADMSPLQADAADAPADGDGPKPNTTDTANAAEEKPSKNPLKKFRRK